MKLTSDWSAFAAEVATNRLLASHLQRIVEFALLEPTTDALEADIRAAELRITMELLAKEVKSHA